MKALKRTTSWLDTHPALKDRLDRVGIQPRAALAAALKMQQAGPAARGLFVNWHLVEKLLSDRIVALHRSISHAKRVSAQIVLGRPV